MLKIVIQPRGGVDRISFHQLEDILSVVTKEAKLKEIDGVLKNIKRTIQNARNKTSS